MDISISQGRVIFREGAAVAGEYVIDDRFKPHFRLLNTPAGHNTVVVSPGDHRHHKGLMYGLRCSDINFWEEDPGTGHCGIQQVVQTELLEGGIRQELLWKELDGGLETYHEERFISCCHRPEAAAFHWTWTSRREALRDHRLIKSEWSCELPDGRKINYHGLGIRLPWMWAFGGNTFTGVEVGGTAAEPVEACGSNGRAITWWGRIDGHWEPPLAAVTMRQDQGFSWFVLKGDFSYVAVGPSNEHEVKVSRGEIPTESYEVIVQDRNWLPLSH